MEYKTLENETPANIHQCFREAFSDYIIPVELPFEKYQSHITRYGVDLALSVGLYHEKKLVGFILNGVGTWNGRPTLYDAGTGITREHRGKGHSKKMLEFVREKAAGKGFEQYLLEVIKGNTPAQALYSKQGFEVVRELSCFKIDRKAFTISTTPTDPGVKIRELTTLGWQQLTGFWNFPPSWQNSIQAVERVSGRLGNLGAFIGEDCMGYLIFDPEFGNIVQLAVAKEMRRKGIGTMLLARAKEGSEGAKELRVLNVETVDRETMGFFRDHGFTNDADQYEMMLEFDSWK